MKRMDGLNFYMSSLSEHQEKNA